MLYQAGDAETILPFSSLRFFTLFKPNTTMQTLAPGSSELKDPDESEKASLPQEPWPKPQGQDLGISHSSFRTSGPGGHPIMLGSRVRVSAGGRVADGTLVAYGDLYGTCSVRMDEGELEKSLPTSRIQRILFDVSPQFRCWFEGCKAPIGIAKAGGPDSDGKELRVSVTITRKTMAGGQNWNFFSGRTFCLNCYVSAGMILLVALPGVGSLFAELVVFVCVCGP